MTVEKVETIIPRTKAAKAVIGKIIKCKFCNEPQAQVRLEARRLMVHCHFCQSDYYLKEQKNLSTN